MYNVGNWTVKLILLESFLETVSVLESLGASGVIHHIKSRLISVNGEV